MQSVANKPRGLQHDAGAPLLHKLRHDVHTKFTRRLTWSLLNCCKTLAFLGTILRAPAGECSQVGSRGQRSHRSDSWMAVNKLRS